MEIKNLPTSAEGAYPEVMITTKDRNTANILQNLYCDCNSETEAVLGYIYQYYITQPMEEDIAEIFEKISITEMRHHELLGKTIVKLGGVPYYVNGRNMPFRISCISPTRNLKEILRNNIKDEERAIENYERAIDRIDNDSIKDLLKRIIEDEQVHLKTLQTILEYVSFYK